MEAADVTGDPVAPCLPLAPSQRRQGGGSASRHARLLLAEATRDLEEISREFASVDLVRAMGRRRGRRVRPAKYLRESQPKTKYVTDPRALTMGHQDLRPAQFLIDQLDKGRVERLRRFQPKAKRKRRRGRKGKRRRKGKREKQRPQGLDGIHLGEVVPATGPSGSSTVADAAPNSHGARGDSGSSAKNTANEDRLRSKPHAIHPEDMTFISRPVPHCHIEAMKFEDAFLRRKESEKKDPKLVHMMNHLLRLLEHHDKAGAVVTTGSSLWSSLPVNLEEQILAPAVQSFYESTWEHADDGGSGVTFDDSEDDDDTHSLRRRSISDRAKHMGKAKGRNRKNRKTEVTATMKLDELYDLQSKTFEQQVESIVHDILAWFFAHHDHGKMGNCAPRTGRAAVVKRYEEFCNQPGAGNGVLDMAAMAVRHHGLDPLSTANQREGIALDASSTQKRGDTEDDDSENDNNDVNVNAKEQPLRDFVQENKHSQALIVRKPENMNEKLLEQSKRRRESTAMVFQRRASLVVKKHEDIQLRTLQRLQRIRDEMEKVEKERRARMWIVFFKCSIFFKRTSSPFLDSKRRDVAAFKLQTLFRKRLFETRGPVMLRVMRLFQRRLMPRLNVIRARLKNRDADQLLAFCRDVKEMGRFTWAIRNFKKHMVLSQRVFRGYLCITDARMEALERLWVVCEKQRQEGIILQNKKRIEQMKKRQQRASHRHRQQRGDLEEDEAGTATHRRRKRNALKLLGGDIGQLKRIEKHIDAIEMAEEAFREAVKQDALQMLKEKIDDGKCDSRSEGYRNRKKNKKTRLRRRPSMRGLCLLSGNKYTLDGNVVFQQPPAREDMTVLLEEAVDLANQLASARRKHAQGRPSKELPPPRKPVTEAEARAILIRSSVAGNLNRDHLRAATDYLRVMLDDAANSFV
eukprot:g1227.t1